MTRITSTLHISIVSPVYRAENIVDKLVEEILKAVSCITDSFEIVLVDDGSPDCSWERIVINCEKDSRVKGLRLSRNFGQHYAIAAGLENTIGSWIIVMDCDMQDKPCEIPNLYNKAISGYDIVYAKRLNRKDNWIKKTCSQLFYIVLGYLTGTSQDRTIANFGIYSRKSIQAVCDMKDSVRNFNTMIRWVGFKSTAINVDHSEREIGKTTYTFRKAFKLALDTMLSFSDKPLRITVQIGLIISCVSFLIGIAYIASYLLGHIQVLGFASIIISIWFLSGIIIFVLGIVGLYIGKVFEKVKERPNFIIAESIGMEQHLIKY